MSDKTKYVTVRRVHFNATCAENLTMTEFKKLNVNALNDKSLLESDVEEAYYLCGGKKTKRITEK